jgi:pimeloyl-ACP methyl ester carboxylesterase
MIAGDMAPRHPLVLLPGLDGTGRLFAGLVDVLPATIEPLVVPYPSDRALGYHELADVVRAQLPEGRRFALLGESFSGPLAIRLAALKPAGLAAVVLVASFHRRPVSAGLAALEPLLRPFVGHLLPRFAIRRLLTGADAPLELVDEVRAAVRRVHRNVLAARLREALQVDASRDLADCTVPVLHITGRRDGLLRPGIAGEMHALLPSMEMLELDAPHLVAQRRPAATSAAVAEFLARVAGSGPQRGPPA